MGILLQAPSNRCRPGYPLSSSPGTRYSVSLPGPGQGKRAQTVSRPAPASAHSFANSTHTCRSMDHSVQASCSQPSLHTIVMFGHEWARGARLTIRTRPQALDPRDHPGVHPSPPLLRLSTPGITPGAHPSPPLLRLSTPGIAPGSPFPGAWTWFAPHYAPSEPHALPQGGQRQALTYVRCC